MSKYFLQGTGISLFIGFLIMVFLKSGFYVRATMEAKSKFSNLFLIVSIIIASVIFGFIYDLFKKEQD